MCFACFAQWGDSHPVRVGKRRNAIADRLTVAPKWQTARRAKGGVRWPSSLSG
jgi:hypothetical protein